MEVTEASSMSSNCIKTVFNPMNTKKITKNWVQIKKAIFKQLWSNISAMLQPYNTTHFSLSSFFFHLRPPSPLPFFSLSSPWLSYFSLTNRCHLCGFPLHPTTGALIFATVPQQTHLDPLVWWPARRACACHICQHTSKASA